MGGLRILFVDDDDLIRNLVQDILSKYVLSLTASGEEAWSLFQKTNFDVLITDLSMPGMSGLELIKRTRSIDEEIPIIVVSGRGETQVLIEAINLKANAYVQKPFENEILLHAVREAEEKINLRRERRDYREKLEKDFADKKEELDCARTKLELSQGVLQLAVGQLRERINMLSQLYEEGKLRERKFRLLFRRSPIGIASFDACLKLVDCNEAFLNILGETDDIKEQDILVYEPFVASQLSEALLACRDLDVSVRDYKYVKPDGENIFLRCRIVPDKNDSPQCETILFVEDITLEAMAKKQLEAMAKYDALTGLLKQDQYDVILKKEVEAAAKGDSSLLVISIDLDFFKTFNDSFGHQAGDWLLKFIGERIRLATRKSDRAFRKGGDEFAIILRDYNPDNVTMIVQRLFKSLMNPFRIEGVSDSHHCTFSVGVSVFSPGKSGEELTREADIAMYVSKKNGRARVTFFEGGMTMSGK